MYHKPPPLKTDGLRERAIYAAVRQIGERRLVPPDLVSVAEAIEEPLDKVQARFPDGHDLLHAAAEQALVLLIETCTRVVVQADPKDPVAQFGALGDAFLEWADTNREQFRMISDQLPLDVKKDLALNRYLDSIVELMARMLTRARDQGRLHPREDIQGLVLSSVSFAYGLARLVVDGRLVGWAPGQDPLVVAKGLARDYVVRIARSSQADAEPDAEVAPQP